MSVILARIPAEHIAAAVQPGDRSRRWLAGRKLSLFLFVVAPMFVQSRTKFSVVSMTSSKTDAKRRSVRRPCKKSNDDEESDNDNNARDGTQRAQHKTRRLV